MPKGGEGGIQRKTEIKENTTEYARSLRHIGGKIVRSASVNENSFVSLSKCHDNVTKSNVKRSRSLPIILSNLNEP